MCMDEMDKRDLYLSGYELNKKHYMINNKIYNKQDIEKEFGIKENKLDKYIKGKTTLDIDIIQVENTPEILERYANQLGKTTIKKCEACGITSNEKDIFYVENADMYLCVKHERQFKNHGKILDDSPVCVFDPNRYYIYGDIALVECYDQHGYITRYFICDADDIDIVKKCKWRIVRKDGNDYVVTGNQKSRKAYFHEDVLGYIPDGYEGDHKNKDTLDNRKSNLRIATSSQQKINKRLPSNNKSGFKGICKRVKEKDYMIDFVYEKKRIYFVKFSKLEEAVYVRYNMELAIYPEYRDTWNDKNILKEIKKITKQRKEELDKYIELKVHEFKTSPKYTT